MVMERPTRRVLTIEEARALPPPTPAELERHRAALQRASANASAILAARDGTVISESDLEWALAPDDDRDEASFAK